MVRAQAGVFRNAPAELAEHHDHHVIGVAEPLHVANEGGDVVDFAPEARVYIALVDTGVEGIVAIRDVVDFGRESAAIIATFLRPNGTRP